MIALFSVHCSKKKGGGLGLGILALAGGGGSSSSSSNDPELDEVKKKIESTIKFSIKNENQILSNFNSVDLSITGDFLQDLGKLQKVKMEYSVSAAGSTKTIAKKEIDITKQFVTDKKIPLTLNLSSLKPDTGVAHPKLTLKFSADGKQIILKDWTQNFVLKGQNQKLLFTDKDDKPLEEGVIFRGNTTVKVKAKNLPSSIQVRIETTSKNISAIGEFGNFDEIVIPNKEKTSQTEPTVQLNPTKQLDASLVKARAFIRFKNTEDWQALSETVYRSYAYSNRSLGTYDISVNKTILNQGDDLIVTIRRAEKDIKNIENYISNINPNQGSVSGTRKSNLFTTIYRAGDVRAVKEDGNEGTANTLPTGGGNDAWRGIDYFTDFSKNTGTPVKDYQFTFNGIKKSISFYSIIAATDLFTSEDFYIKILVKQP